MGKKHKKDKFKDKAKEEHRITSYNVCYTKLLRIFLVFHARLAFHDMLFLFCLVLKLVFLVFLTHVTASSILVIQQYKCRSGIWAPLINNIHQLNRCVLVRLLLAEFPEASFFQGSNALFTHC